MEAFTSSKATETGREEGFWCRDSGRYYVRSWGRVGDRAFSLDGDRHGRPAQERLIVTGKMVMNRGLGSYGAAFTQAKPPYAPHLGCCEHTFRGKVPSLSDFRTFKSLHKGKFTPPPPSHLSFMLSLCLLPLVCLGLSIILCIGNR